MILSMLYGVHTYSVGMVLTYEQFKKIQSACYKTECIEDKSSIWTGKERLYCYAFMEQGIKIYLHGKSGKLYQLRIQIEPCRVLGEKDPTALATLDKDAYKKLVKTADKLLKKLKIPCSIDKMKVSRCDLTVNVEFFNQDVLMEYLRIFKKSLVPSAYTHVYFEKNSGKSKITRLPMLIHTVLHVKAPTS